MLEDIWRHGAAWLLRLAVRFLTFPSPTLLTPSQLLLCLFNSLNRAGHSRGLPALLSYCFGRFWQGFSLVLLYLDGFLNSHELLFEFLIGAGADLGFYRGIITRYWGVDKGYGLITLATIPLTLPTTPILSPLLLKLNCGLHKGFLLGSQGFLHVDSDLLVIARGDGEVVFD